MIAHQSPSITIRPYGVADAAALTNLFRSSVREIASRDYTAARIRAWAPDEIDAVQFGRRCEAKSTWVAELEGRIAGFSDLAGHGARNEPPARTGAAACQTYRVRRNGSKCSQISAKRALPAWNVPVSTAR